MIKLSVCQITSENKYPVKEIRPNGDTTVVVSMEQVDKINITYINLEECKELNKNKDSIIIINNEKIELLDSTILEKDLQLQVKDTIIDSKDNIIDNKDKIIDEKDKKTFWLKVGNVVFITTTILFAILAAG
jgi:hypothetical protein